MEQRTVHAIRVPHRPAQIRRSPVDLARLDPVDVAHAPGEGNEVAAVIAHDALGISGGARGVDDVERIGGEEWNAVHRRRARRKLGPVVVPSWYERRLTLGALEHDAALR